MCPRGVDAHDTVSIPHNDCRRGWCPLQNPVSAAWGAGRGGGQGQARRTLSLPQITLHHLPVPLSTRAPPSCSLSNMPAALHFHGHCLWGLRKRLSLSGLLSSVPAAVPWPELLTSEPLSSTGPSVRHFPRALMSVTRGLNPCRFPHSQHLSFTYGFSARSVFSPSCLGQELK